MKKLVTLLFVIIFVQMSFGQLSGTYYIGATPGSRPGGGDPEYASLGAAFTALNTSGINGPSTFYFLDASYTEAANIALACTGTSITNTITFKPYTGVTPNIHFTQLADNSGPSGLIIIGSNTTSSYTLVKTDYVTIDGSNTDGGTTRDLSITNVNNTPTFQYGIRIVGDNDNITIKNISLTLTETGGTSTYGILFTIRNQSSTNYVPDNGIVENCNITVTGSNAGQCIAVSTSGTIPSGVVSNGLIVRNNTLTARTRGIFLQSAIGYSIYGNTISINQTNTGALSHGIYAFSTNNVTSHTCNIYNNKLIQLSSANTTGTGVYGISGITLEVAGTFNVYNNFISGFSFVTSTNGSLNGIRVTTNSASFTGNIYHNTINVGDVGLTDSLFAININSTTFAGVVNIQNNIISMADPDAATFCINRATIATGTFTSNYNDLYSSGASAQTGYWGASGAQTNLATWQTSTSQDANSKNVSVAFTSSTDLHLSGGSIGDNNLTGTVLGSYTTDIDGDTRDVLFPYMGADENTTTPLHSLTPRTVPMTSGVSNATSFGTRGVLGTDGSSTFYTHWDDTYLYLGWSGGKTNYSSDMYYAAIDIDPTTTNGTDNAIEYIGFLAGDPKPDFYVVYENNSTFYGAPATNGNAFEIYNVSGGTWNWVSRTDGDDGTSSQVDFLDASGEVRLRIPWATLGFTPATGNKLGVVMWNNNASGDYMWGRVPTSNPANGSTPITLTMDFVYNNTGSGINPSSDKIEAALPVELTSFVSNVSGKTINLTWKTATEVNSYGFEIERIRNEDTQMAEGIRNWEKVGSVQASGNSNSPREYSFTDNNLQEGKYQYRLKMLDNDGTFEYSNIIEAEIIAPKEFVLSQNYPNPFNPVTTINYAIPIDSKVMLVVYNINGEKVAELVNEMQTAGSYNIPFSATGLASGTYIYRLQVYPTAGGAGEFMQTKKMILLK